jgi:AcrR family transcriptional regulator
MIDPNICCGAPKTRSEERRIRVILAARKLFIENGFHATGIAQIAKESGVLVGQLYRDFSAKEDIVAAIVNSDCRSFMAADALRVAIDDGQEELVREWIRQFVLPEDDEDDSRLFAEIIAEAARNRRIAAIFTDIHDDVRVLMLAALEMLAPGDAVADRRAALADAILTMSLGLMHHQLLRPQTDLKPLVRTLLEIIDRDINALRAVASAGSGLMLTER